MNSIRKQRGLGLFGLIFVLGLIGFVVLILVKTIPIYLNEMAIRRDLHEVGTQLASSGSEVDVDDTRRSIQHRWDIDYITALEPKDIHIQKSEAGVTISYDYEARANLFANVFIVIHFAEIIPVNAHSVG
jgi:hypothetical protein